LYAASARHAAAQNAVQKCSARFVGVKLSFRCAEHAALLRAVKNSNPHPKAMKTI